MKLLKIDTAIRTCNEHLSQTNSRQTEIESFLTQYLLVLMCATFEEEIESILLKRADKIHDLHIKSFFKNCIDKTFRSIKSSELSGILGKFGADYKETFQKKANGTVEETSYNSIVVNRHDTAHSKGSPITFNELVQYYEKGHIILDYLNEALENSARP
ncbi:MAG: hypothetical protein IPK96_13540 [Flammeovirgaceae bacterium]|jgi:hypothetical protein|nr:hypothetical protein [Flammeovirgaceae bacterium]